MIKIKAIACVLCFVFVVSGIHAAPQGEGKATSGPVSFSYWVPFDVIDSSVLRSYDENHVVQELERRTGIQIEFLHPAAGQEVEAYNLMIASGDLPDLIQHSPALMYPGGWDEAIETGDFVELSALIRDHAPNYDRIISSDPTMLKLNKTDRGNIYGFQMLETEVQPSYLGPVIRQDWLDDLNLSVPVTINDWYSTLKAFKEQKGATYPLGLNRQGYFNQGEFSGAFDTYHDLFLADGKVKYGPILSGWKEYLTLMNQWLDEGLIDPEFVSWDDNKNNYLSEGLTGAWREGFWMFVVLENRLGDSDMLIVPAPYPVMEEGGEVHVRQTNYKVRGFQTSITSACDEPEQAAEWLDFAYSDEGYMLFNYGIEGEAYNLVDGEVVFTDLITNNPQGLSMSEARRVYQMHHGPYVRDWRAIVMQFTDREIGAHDVWGDGPSDGIIPPLTLTPEESTERANILNDVRTYMEQMTIKFIRGDEPLSDFDKYIETIEKMGVARAVEITQTAYDRFQNR